MKTYQQKAIYRNGTSYPGSLLCRDANDRNGGPQYEKRIANLEKIRVNMLLALVVQANGSIGRREVRQLYYA